MSSTWLLAQDKNSQIEISPMEAGGEISNYTDYTYTSVAD